MFSSCITFRYDDLHTADRYCMDSSADLASSCQHYSWLGVCAWIVNWLLCTMTVLLEYHSKTTVLLEYVVRSVP